MELSVDHDYFPHGYVLRRSATQLADRYASAVRYAWKELSDDTLSVLQPIPFGPRIRFWPMAFGLWPHILASARRGTAVGCLHRRREEQRCDIAGDDVVMPLTPGAQIDELRRALRESEQRRKAAEIKLADRQLGTASQTIAAQDRRIGWLMAEVARLRDAAASTLPDDYLRDATRFFNVYSIGGAR